MRSRRISAIVVFGATMAVFGSIPTLATVRPATVLPAAVTYKPDGLIRFQKVVTELSTHTYSEAWLGNNIYNTTGSNQTRKWKWYSTSGNNQKFTFGLEIGNDGNVGDRFKLKATGAASNWAVKYYRGSTNITSAVEAGTYTTSQLAPGSTLLITAVVTKNASAVGDFSRLVTMASVGASSNKDAVKLVVKFSACGC